ncbi:alpha-2C adrenergic receptor [Coccinella septempunctata]|uniref:alpha-2C adrenergic receptor n=1 Tax=Coccinella septempunctata TaxID=41139 RepID=UPI001D087AB8|nr:alpha-2C adrenergic receptor [Coccinella septempunctata]
MALANVTPHAAMAVEDILMLFENSTSNSSNNTIAIAHYPSGYGLPQIVVASIVATILMIIVVVGNMLVIIAITTEKSLKSIQNWFIGSLAVADFFLGLIIMPFSLANELMGYWIFGTWWCDIHSAMDVLLSTASIMNLCLISLDRYWSITQAVEYLKKRTPVRAIVMIAAVWILSALICIPPLLGWKVERTEEEQYPQCQLSEELGYVLYSALGSFYIPSCIMVFVYIRIYYAAKARARRGIRKPPRRQPQDAVTSFTNTAGDSKNGSTREAPAAGSVDRNSNTSPRDGERQIATIESHPRPIPIPTVTCDLASDISTSDQGELANNEGIDLQKDTLQVFPSAQVVRSSLSQCQLSGSTLSVNGELQQQAAAIARTRQHSMGIDTDMVSEFDPSSSDSGVVARCTVVKPLKLRLCKPIFGRRTPKNRRSEGKKLKNHSEEMIVEQVVPKVQKPRDPEREKRRLARKKEKRATLILGLIMGSFIACWLPFFIMYILRLAYDIPNIAFLTAFWLGYMNSALNPVIYTIFNKDFRRAFRRILFK